MFDEASASERRHRTARATGATRTTRTTRALRGVRRLAALALVPGLLLAGTVAGTGTATAEEQPRTPGGVAATLSRLTVHGTVTIRDAGEEWKTEAGLYEMTVTGGGTLQSYGVDLRTAARTGTTYKEVGWDESSLHQNKNAGKIRWILEHSYPQVNDLSELAERADVKSLDVEAAAAGTQAAIWRFSDDVEAVPADRSARKLAAYLERAAERAPEPQASLVLDPPALAGRAGDRVGPVTVRTRADRVTVAPSADAPHGMRIVDAEDRVVLDVGRGARLYFHLPEDVPSGTGALTVQADARVSLGRALVSDTHSQTQIVAGSSASTVTAEASVIWADKKATGAVPALSAKKDCAKGAVALTGTNAGDAPFAFELLGARHTIPAHGTRRVTIPLQEDQAYDLTVSGPDGLRKNFKGVLDCETAGAVAIGTADAPANRPTPATGGNPTPLSAAPGENLAETGASGATTPILYIALGLLVLGTGAVVLLRKKKPAPTPEDH
ncbi:TQXA domain-containing protein [Streptomyces spiroverticillatus]|uniref:TQXA domain-containing protein n=1 Tax=Streptomyces finlayi TaxID=67296 RepID=A0A918WY99_9ACTN|nr:TQXA domain-containing protein [Streptomyces finlayi]GHA11679.1 TQXA domain-containing protein [Streptomyces spiroverticillatus]GHC94902.1 TQXA domain-containing protein [Streptomyces finlayi]